jgi:hypothetical protein
MVMRDLMKVLKEKGDCTELMFPYGSEGLPSIPVLINGSSYKINNYAAVNTINDLKTALYVNGPCIITIPVYNHTERLWFQNPGEELLGGHALCIVGYIKEGIIIRNSWGTDWGQEGYCIMPYADFGVQYEIWTTIDEKSINPPIPPNPIPPDPIPPDPPTPPIPPDPKKTWINKYWWIIVAAVIGTVAAIILL